MQHCSEMCLDVGLELLWCSSAVGCPKEYFLQKSPFCFTAWDFTTAELFMKLNYFPYLSQVNTLRGFLKANPDFITSCSLLDNLGIILLLISPVEMKLLWIGMDLMEAEIWTAGFFYSWKKRQISNHLKFPLNRSSAVAECQLGIELPRENTRIPIPSAVLYGVFSFRKIKPRSEEIHQMTNSKNFITVVRTCICKSYAKGYRTNPILYFVHRKTHLQHTILSMSRHGNDCP